MYKAKLSLIIITALSTIFGADVYTPKSFKSVLDDATGKAWVPASVSAVENRAHIVLIDNTGSYCLQVGSDIKGSLVAGDVNALKDGTATYGDALRSMFQILDMNTSSLATNSLSGTYTIHPELASYYAIDADGNALTVRDKSSFYQTSESTSAYLVFTIVDAGQSSVSYFLKASSRYVYSASAGAYEMDNSWSQDQWVKLDTDMTVVLTSVESEATAWTLANARDLIDIGVDQGSAFNPGNTTWQTNSFAAYPVDQNTGDLAVWNYDDSPLKTNQFYNNVDDDYQNQLGHSETADAAATAVLNVIDQNLINMGESLRYSKETYLAFRSALLENNFSSVDLYNAKLGERTVEHVYFTSAYDDDGVYHPFMIIATHNAPSGPQFLIDVARPPGDGTPGTSYDQQTVTRNAVLEQKLVKIPLKDYGLISTLLDNDLTSYGTLGSDANLSQSDWDVDNYTSLSSTGIAVDGVIIYPSSNNVLIYASLAAEITSTGIHVGRGMGFHYHADGHGFNGNGINLYNASDYDGHSHPPVIGFVFDGIALFGNNDEGTTALDGASEDLDDYGGHDHDDYGYHYHAHSGTTTQQNGPNTHTFNQNFLQKGAFKGLINDVPGFLNVGTNQFMDSDIKRYVGGSGTSQLSATEPDNAFVPNSFVLYQNYPNPFNPVTRIKYDISENSNVSVNVYNLMGEKVATLVNQYQNAGYYFTNWDSRNDLGISVSAGVYIYQIKAGKYVQSRKLILLK
jgi:hypothetical protein